MKLEVRSENFKFYLLSYNFSLEYAGHTIRRDREARAGRRFCMADSTGRELTFGRALVGSLLLARASAIRRRVVPPGESIGLLLPASVGGALANVATPRSPACGSRLNLNFTAGRDAMTAAIDRCGIATGPDLAHLPRPEAGLARGSRAWRFSKTC